MKSLEEVLIENKKRIYEKKKQEYLKQQKKEERLTIFIATFIVVLTCALIFALGQRLETELKECIELGFSEDYCREHL